MCHWQSLLGKENVSSSSMHCPTGVAKGAKISKRVCHSALGHFYPALCLSSAKCEGAAVQELKATAGAQMGSTEQAPGFTKPENLFSFHKITESLTDLGWREP